MTFPIHFLLCNIVVAFLLGSILLFRKIFKKYITVSSQYYMWYIFILALLLPFMPFDTFSPAHLAAKIQAFFSSGTSAAELPSAPQSGGSSIVSQLGISDFAASVGHTSLSALSLGLSIVWAAGCAVTLLYFAYNMYRIHSIRVSSCEITAENEPDLYEIYRGCTEELNIRRRVSLYASCSISSPVSYGLIRPAIIIPQDMDIVLPEEDIRFIFLHELQHYKHRDALLNYLSCLLQIVYWFNPLIWYGFFRMRQDREFACDHSVIRTAGKEHAIRYGYTLIHYAEKLHRNAFLSPLSSLGGEKAVITQRIKEIANYRAETSARRLRSICLLLLITTLVYAASPLLTAYASQDATYDFAGENVTSVDLSSYFHGMEGSFVLYDMTENRYHIYNEEQSTVRVSPDSTFKIYSALFALEEGVIAPDSSSQAWDGTQYSFDSWNKDQTLSSAMRDSVNWYFQNLDAETGYSALSSWYSRIAYGNCDLSGGIANYWAESSLKISPVEQVNLLSGLLRNEWELDPQNIQAVREAMFISDTPAGRLYGKTGTGLTDGQNSNGWFVGFLETDEHTYCFALNLHGSDGASGSAAAEIAVNILTDGQAAAA